MEGPLHKRAPELRILDEQPGQLVIASYDNVNVTYWRSAASGELAERLDRVVEPWVAAHPEGVSSVHLVADSAGLPTKEARDAFAASVKRWLPSLACVAVVIEREGFWGSALRSAVTGIFMLAPAGFPASVHRSIEAAAPWLADHHAARTGTRLSSHDLNAALTALQEDGTERDDRPRSNTA